MKRLALAILGVAATLDIASDPHSRTLLDDMLDASPDQSLLGMFAASPLTIKIEYWAATLIVLTIVSLILSSRRRRGPDIIGR